jgi:heat shock protein 5
MDDPEIQHDAKLWPFKVGEKSGKLVINVRYKGEEKEFVSSVHSDIH